MEHCCYLTKICYVSLGTKRNTPKEKKNHSKATRTKTECNTSKTGSPR